MKRNDSTSCLRLLTGLAAALILASPAINLRAQNSQPTPNDPGAELAAAQTNAFVWTDKPDYAPGSTAQIYGTNFQPGEAVTLQVVHADGTVSTGSDHQPWTITAAADGSLASSWEVCTDDCLGATLLLSATGLVSGASAEVLFADGTASAVVPNGNGALAWGYGYYGQLGNGTFYTASPYGSSTPVTVLPLPGGRQIVSVAGGGYNAVALANDGTIWTWGSGEDLGNGTMLASSSAPVQVNALPGGRQAVAISAGFSHCLALANDGTVWAWGYGYQGQLGNGTFYTSPPNGSSTPVQVSGFGSGRQAIAIAGGGDHSLALASDGTVWAWGYGYQGQLGNGSFYTSPPYGSSTPVQVSGFGSGRPAIAIAGGEAHSLALASDGTVWAWGYGYEGQLGNGVFYNTGSPDGTSTPVQVSGFGPGLQALAIAGGVYHSLALASDGTVWAWGYGYEGELGNGVFYNTGFPFGSSTPVQVMDVPANEKVLAVAAGGFSSFALVGPVNQPPVLATAIPNQSATYGTPFTYTLPSGTFTDSDGDTISYTAGGLPPGIIFDGASRTLTGTPIVTGSYTVTVTATDSGSPQLSASTTFSFTVSPAPLTIAADMKSKAYGAPLPVFTATASGLVNGDTLSSLNGTLAFACLAVAASPVGNYAITLSGLSSPNYTISFSPGTLTINPVALAVAADSQIKAYGAALPALTVSYSGFVNGDTPASLTTLPSPSTTATAASPVGSYPITVSGAVDPNYTISYSPGTLTINPVSLAIAADNQAKAYGAPLPSLTVNYSGFVNGDTPASLTTPPSPSTTATAASPVGSYPITVSGAVDPNYTISYSPGTLTINPVSLAIAADNQAKAYGAPLPGLTVSYSGFVNGDTPASLTTPPSPSTTATAASPVGAYAINVSGAADPNYTISYAPGTLTINPVSLTVAADNQVKAYGAPLPSLTVSYSGFVNGDTPASLTTPPSPSTTATAASPVGSYPITVSGAADPNYTISYAPGTLTINPVSLAVTALNQTKVYGQTFTFAGTEFSAAGLVNGDSVSTVTLASDGTAPGALVNNSPYAITPSAAVGNGLANYNITYVNGQLSVTPAPLTVSVNAPATGEVVPTNSVLSFSGAFTPSGVVPYNATWSFVSADSPAMTVPGSFGPNNTITSPAVTFTLAGVYVVTLTVTDGAGTTANGAMTGYVVVYNPEGGFVTGGGSFLSPAGAYVPNPGLTGKATFGFVSKYHNGATMPDGNTQFTLTGEGLSFHSSSYQWLVISGSDAQYSGSGTLNGAAGYSFLLSAVDGKLAGDGTDELRLQITDPTGNVVYDNQAGAPGGSAPTTAIQGSIVIHD